MAGRSGEEESAEDGLSLSMVDEDFGKGSGGTKEYPDEGGEEEEEDEWADKDGRKRTKKRKNDKKRTFSEMARRVSP